MLIRRVGLPRGFQKRVVFPGDYHSAHIVCASPIHWSPEFVHLDEQIYMTYPLCNTTITDNCYDFDYHVLITGTESAPRDYCPMEKWEKNGNTTVTSHPGRLRTRSAAPTTSGALGMGGLGYMAGHVMRGSTLFFIFSKPDNLLFLTYTIHAAQPQVTFEHS